MKLFSENNIDNGNDIANDNNQIMKKKKNLLQKQHLSLEE